MEKIVVGAFRLQWFMFKWGMVAFVFFALVSLLGSCQSPQLVSTCVMACHQTVIAQNSGAVPALPATP